MPTFITLGRFTQQGIENIKESPGRVEKAREAFRAMGADLKAFYAVQGQYDFVVISEAPDAATVAKLSLALEAQGNVRTETLTALSEDEYRDVIAGLP